MTRLEPVTFAAIVTTFNEEISRIDHGVAISSLIASSSDPAQHWIYHAVEHLTVDSLPHITVHPPFDRPPASVVVLAAVLAMSSMTSFISSPVVAEHSA